MYQRNIAKSWGSYAWYFLHFLALNYNNELKKDYIKFINHFQSTIPCIICKNNFINKLRTYPIKKYLVNKEKFFEWTVLLHNDVNRRTQRKIYSINEAKKLYENKYNKKKILLFLKNFYESNIYGNKVTLFKLFNQIINIYPNNNIKTKLINFRKKCKMNENKSFQWYYVYFNIIKNS